MIDINIMDHVRPELLVVAVVLYFLGNWIKQSDFIQNKYIPMVLGLVGIVICAIYILAIGIFENWHDVVMAIFSSITQGVLMAGLSTYVNQLVKHHWDNKE